MAAIVLFAGWALLVGAAGGWATQIGSWYNDLRKPRWQPPGWLFAPAWTLIFALTAWAGVLAWRGADPAGRPGILIAYLVNGVLNVAWSPLFFRWRRPDWALIELPFLWVSIVAAMFVTGRYAAAAPWLLTPYLAWVTFAGLLNRRIVTLNAPFTPA